MLKRHYSREAASEALKLCSLKKVEKKGAEEVPQRSHYPSLYISSDKLPALKGLDVGDKVKILGEAEVSGISTIDEDGKKASYTLNILKLGLKKGGESKGV